MSTDRPSTYPPLREVRAEVAERRGYQPGLEISDIRVRLTVNGRLRAFASIVLNSVFRVTDIRIIEGDQRFFVAMPSRKYKDGNYQDIAHPVDPDFRHYMEHRILDVYHRAEAEARGE